MSSTEFELSGASDVNEVIEWAHENAAGRTFTVYVVVPDQDQGIGIVRLLGTDPTRRL